jgi:hypothetical protein
MFSAICITVVAVACSKNAHYQKSGHDSRLTGTWQWERTDGGIGNHIHETPQSTGKNIVLKLSADSTYILFTNDEITAQGTYRIENRTCIHDHTSKPFLIFSASAGMMVEKQDAEHLSLSDEKHDGTKSLYKRTATGVR